MNIFSKANELITKSHKEAGKRIEGADKDRKPSKRAGRPRKKAK